MTNAAPTGPEVFIPTAGYHVAKLDPPLRQVATLNDAFIAYWTVWWKKVDELQVLEHPRPGPTERLVIYQNKASVVQPPPPMLDATGAPLVDPATGMPPPPPPVPASWYEEREKFPNYFDDDMKDWLQLEPVSPRRDQVWLDLGAQEALVTGQNAMAGAPPLTQPKPYSPTTQPPPEQTWPK